MVAGGAAVAGGDDDRAFRNQGLPILFVPRGCWRRRRGGQCSLDCLAYRVRVGDDDAVILGDDEDRGGHVDADLFAEDSIRLHFLKERSCGVLDEGWLLAVMLKPLTGERAQVVLVGDEGLSGKDIPSKVVG